MKRTIDRLAVRFSARLSARFAAAVAPLVLAGAVCAQTTTFELDRPSEPLGPALSALARATGARILFPSSLTDGKTAPAVRGRYAARDAFQALLAGSGLVLREQGDGSFTVERAPVATTSVETVLPPVRVKVAPDAAGGPPAPYAGGQVARGGTVGLLGDLDMLDAPVSTQSYTSETIRTLGARSPLDVLALDPSIQRAIGVTEGNDQFTSRGFVQFGFRSYVVNGLAGIGATQGNDAELYERIEAIRGPTALFNGGAAALNVGTTVNLVTKKAPDVPLVRATTRLESRDLWTNQVDVGRRFGDDNAWGVRVNALSTDGHRNDDIESGFRRRLGSLDLDWRGERVRAYAHLYALDYRTDPYGAVNPLTLDAPDPRDPPPRVIALRGNAVESHQSGGQVGVEWDFARDSTLAVAWGRKSSHTEQPYSYLTALDPASGDATQVNGLYVDSGRNSAFDATIRSRVQTGPVSHRLALNASRSDSRSAYAGVESAPFATNVFDQVAGPSVPRIGPGPDVGTERIGSVGIVDMIGLLDDRLLLTLGARRVRIQQANDNDGDGVIETIYGKSKTTPGIAVLWKATPAVSVYGNRVESLDPGETAPLNTGDPADFVSNPGQVFAPTQARQLELGVKWDLARRVALTAAVFRIERPSFFRNETTRFYGPQGQQRNRGLELNVAGEPWRGIRLLGGYSYIDAKLTATGDPSTEGATAIGVPKHNLVMSGEWDVPQVAGLTLLARGSHRSSQQADVPNRREAPAVTLGGLGANYVLPTARRIVVRGFVDNIGDVHAYPASLSRGRYSEAARRTWSLALEATL